MNIERLRENIETEIDSILEKNNLLPLWGNALFDNTPERKADHDEALKVFSFLFSLDENARIYLWNRLFYQFKWSNWDNVDKSDFSIDELAFLEKMHAKYAQTVKKFGESYSTEQNINAPISTLRLKLCPYTEELATGYIDFFNNNKEEYESYYGDEFSKTYLERFCNQQFRELSFAIILKETNQYVGSIALHLKRNDAVYNIEYYVFPQFRKCGYAKEAVGAIIEAARTRTLVLREETIREGVFNIAPATIKCIEAQVRTNNDASIALLKSQGFELYGKVPFLHKLRGIYIDGYLYELLI